MLAERQGGSHHGALCPPFLVSTRNSEALAELKRDLADRRAQEAARAAAEEAARAEREAKARWSAAVVLQVMRLEAPSFANHHKNPALALLAGLGPFGPR